MQVGSEHEQSLSATQASAALDAPFVPAVPRPGLLRQVPAALRALRPTQWAKNGLVLLGVVFARRLTDIPSVERALLAFVAFSLTASAVYVLNDIADREKDRNHPKKRLRPIASGRLSIPFAVVMAALCVLGAVLATGVLLVRPLTVADPFAKWGASSGFFFAVTIVSYVVMNVAYSGKLKHLVLWDILIIAAGFVLRALAGAFAAAVYISPWFYVCTVFLSLFLAIGKRRAELVNLSDVAHTTRQNLREYTVPFLDQLMMISVTCTLVTYSLYTFQGDTVSHRLMITLPFVIFGVFRYLYLVYVKADGERPDELLFRDKQILASVLLCVIAVLLMLYGMPA